jgi:prepilin-type N-terminal cleavage/methylation domain-containing protein
VKILFFISLRPNNEQSGFSLVELMVVVGIIGILAAVGGSQYKAFVNKARLSK